MTTRSIRVPAQVNNCAAYWTGAAWAVATTTSLTLGYQSASYFKRGFGLKFPEVLIPKNSTINTSKIILTCQLANADVVINARICAELSGAPADFSTIANYQARRGTACGGADDTQHTNTIDWDGIAAHVLDTAYDTPSLNTPLQAAVNASALKHVVFFIDDHDARGDQVTSHWRIFYSYNGSSTTCPLIEINYSPYYKVFPSIKLMQPAHIK
jgi:hypothetical protein